MKKDIDKVIAMDLIADTFCLLVRDLEIMNDLRPKFIAQMKALTDQMRDKILVEIDIIKGDESRIEFEENLVATIAQVKEFKELDRKTLVG